MTRRIVPTREPSVVSRHDDSQFDIVGRNVTFIRGKRRILDEHNWRFQSNQLSAILGPSGCGKSTLLNILLGRLKRNITGFVGVAQSNQKSPPNMRVSFVGQSDHLSHFLTVHETLLLASQLKCPAKKADQHEESASRALELLNLESTRMTKISRLSGGQRRRLSIALELLGNPSMLILDEPTTGLDSGATQQLVHSLNKLLIESRNAGNRMAIIATIHQPSARVFAQFEHIHVMSKHGKALFSDRPDKLLAALKKIDLECPHFHNPADYICELAAGEYGQESVDSLCEITGREKRMASSATGKHLTIDWPEQPFFSQVCHLSGLLICNDIRQPFVLFIRLIEPPLIAVNNGLIFGTIGRASGCVPSVTNLFETKPSELFAHQDAQRWDVYQNGANLFFAALNFFYVGMTPTLLFFPRELGIVAKQHTNGWHSVQSYYAAKIVVELMFVTISVVSFQTIWYPITEQPLDIVRFVALSFVFAGFHMFGFLQGTIFSGIFASSALKSVYMGVLSMLPFILMSGFVVRTERIPSWLRPASFSSYYRFGYELMLLTLYGNDRCDPTIVLDGRNRTTVKAPRWLRLVQYTDPKTAEFNDYELGEWAIDQWFARKNKLEKSWILDELNLSWDGSQTVLLMHHTSIFLVLLLIWFIIAFLIMRHRMSRPAV